MKKFRLLKTCVFAASLALAASGSFAATTGPNATMTIGIGITLNTMDPAQQNTTTVMNVVDYGTETLTTFDEKGKVEPLLATSWEFSPDGKTLTLHLRKDVKFHDGSPFDAKAVKFSLERLISPKVSVPIGQRYKVMSSIDIVDPHTVAIHLKNVVPDFASVLGATMAAIISPDSVGKDGNTYENIQKPIGTGPYILTKRVRGSELDFKRFPDYWGKKPYYENVVFKIMPEATSLEAGLRAGQLDMIMNPPAADLTSLAADPNVKILKAPSDRTIFIDLRTNKPPLENAKVRQALNYAVDKKAIIKNVMFGVVNQSDSPFAPSLNGYCKAGDYSYNPKKAKELLKEAGAENISIKLGTPRGRYVQDFEATQAIASYLRKVGVKVDVGTSDWASYITAVNSVDANPYNAWLLGWAPTSMDAATQMIFMSEEGFPPNGVNGTFFKDQKMEDLFAQAKVELDPKKSDALYCEIQKIIWNQAPFIYLWSQNLVLAYNKNVAGISYQPNEKFVTFGAHPAKE